VPKPHQIAGKRILVVDDVFTTGATLHECAKTLKQAGAARVEALTMARAL
jgi:predicted amidophosphoribosyltransferase